MKKIFISAFIFFVSMSAFACDWDRQDCSNKILGEFKQRINPLLQDPEFVQRYQKRLKELDFKAQYTDNRVRNCNNYRCMNQAYNEFAIEAYLLQVDYKKYKTSGKQTSPVSQVNQTSTIKDKWADQCVIGKNMKVLVYKDVDGTQAIGELGNDAYSVSHTNGGKLVGLKTVPDYTQSNPDANAGKFIGWVKKANLDMQDLRNCN